MCRASKIPNERPDISSTVEGGIIAGGDGDGGGSDGGVGSNDGIASRQLLHGQPSKKAQHLSEAMLAAIASFAFIGAAVLTIVSGGGSHGNEEGGGGGVVGVGAVHGSTGGGGGE